MKYLISYDITRTAHSRHEEFDSVIWDNVHSGTKKLNTTWVGETLCDSADELLNDILGQVALERKLGSSFIRKSLHLLVVVFDDNEAYYAEHRPRNLRHDFD